MTRLRKAWPAAPVIPAPCGGADLSRQEFRIRHAIIEISHELQSLGFADSFCNLNMAEIRKSLPVKLFVGILTSIPSLLPEIEQRLTSRFGPGDSKSDLFPFDQTHYYDEEMGCPIYRQFLSFQDMIDGSQIAEIKISTNELESVLAKENPGVTRPINLDPGYVEQSKVVLASTKNFFHRILVSKGIYAEVTLHYQSGKWRDFPWTFPDYRSSRYQNYFSSLRVIYRNQLSAAGFPIHLRKK
jgi:hypothetical protein